jgi:ABC-2 type transport system permease protein
LRSPDAVGARRAPFQALLVKELRGVLSGRALWTMLLILCPLVGYSLFQAVSLYGEASLAARDQPALASGLSPLDGVFVPTFGAFYVAVTLLFPFVAIRTLGREKETGALRLLIQLPYRVPTLIAAKMAAISIAWLIAAVPALSALAVWLILGGHLHAPETLNLLLGQLLYGLLVGAIALFAASVSEGSATAAIVTLAFTIGSWVLDFALAGQPGLLDLISRLSLTQTLRSFEQGVLSIGLLWGLAVAICGFAALAAIWLHPGVWVRSKLIGSTACVVIAAAALAGATQIRTSFDLTEDRRNSFPAADQRALAELRQPLLVIVHLAPEDPRYVDLRRNVLTKLERVLPHVTIRLAATGQSVVGSTGDEAYGEIEYSYAGRSDKSRSTSHREVLPLLYGLAGMPIPTPTIGEEYPGYPLIASGRPTLLWFCGVLPLLIAIAWWWSGRPPRISPGLVIEAKHVQTMLIEEGGQS